MTTLRNTFLVALVLALALGLASVPSGSGGANVSAAPAVKIDPQLTRLLTQRATVPAIITYKQKPGAAEFSRLQLAGITKGFATRELPMVIADLSALQLAAVSRQPGVVSIYSNRLMKTFTNASRTFIGVPQMTADTQVTKNNTSRTPALPVTGKGVGIGYIDTGIDATHKDLTYGKKTVQNVIQPLSETVVGDGGLVVGVGVSIGDILNSTGFVPPIYFENQPLSDLESGHGTHGAAVAAGTGEQSGGFYGGVARGAQSHRRQLRQRAGPAHRRHHRRLRLPAREPVRVQHPRHQQLMGRWLERRGARPEQSRQRRDAHLARPQHHGRLRRGQLGRHADLHQPLLDDALDDLGRGGPQAGFGEPRGLQLARRR